MAVDPADVRKVVLEEPPGNLPVQSEIVRHARARLFGSWEMNWIAYNYAHDVILPEAKGGPSALRRAWPKLGDFAAERRPERAALLHSS